VLAVLVSVAAYRPSGPTPSPGAASSPAGTATDPVTGTDWHVLFDGETTIGLRGYGQVTFPDASWQVREGLLRTVPGRAVDLVTDDTYGDFELEFTWRATPGGNSGVLYRVVESAELSWTSGPEYQILDDIGHADGADPRTSAGALYGLLEPADDKVLAPVGDDNSGRIVVRGGHVEHWLNDRLLVEYDWRSPAMLARIAESKFRDHPAFMTADNGHIVIQHHGEEVAYGRIRVRVLDP